jgi:hypothetical protein
MPNDNQTVKRCLFFPIQKRSKKQQINNRPIHIVKKLDAYILNEIKITELLKTQTECIHEYCNTFSSFELVGVSAMNDKYLERSERLQAGPGFALFRYSSTKTLNYFDELLSCDEPRIFIYYLINGYKEFLTCIDFFKSHKIINWGLSPKNMLYNPETHAYLIQDLSHCLTLGSKSKEEKALHFSSFDPTHYFLPIEFHVISYITKNKETSISAFKIDAIIKTYMDSHPHIKKFSNTFAESYYKECEIMLKPFINKPADYIVDTLLDTTTKTWDTFILSSFLINIIFGLKTQVNKYTGWLDRVLKLLLLNTYPRFEKRKTFVETVALFDAICNNDAAVDDLRNMIICLNADSLKKVNQHLLECNRFIISAFESRKKRGLMFAGLAAMGSPLL